MGNEIALYESAFDSAGEQITNILRSTPSLQPLSFKSAMLSQMVNSKAAGKLMACSTVSFLNCAATFAGLGLMPDGLTGQAYMIPFGGVATPIIGYMGYNTLGDRAGRTIDGNVVRQGDRFDFSEGTNPFVDHRRIDPTTGLPLAAPGARITWGWATATAPGRTPLIVVMTLEDLEAVRMKSPAKDKSDSPWNDLATGRPAMYAKTAKRRLRRGMPLVHGAGGNFIRADVMEGRFEATHRPHYFLPGGDGEMHVTDGITGDRVAIRPPTAIDPTEPMTLKAILNPAEEVPHEYQSAAEWRAALMKIIDLNGRKLPALKNILSANAQFLKEANTFGGEFAEAALDISSALSKAITTLERN